MKCKDAYEMINSYFDNNINPMEDNLLAEHLRSCPDCRAEFELAKKYREVLKTIKPVHPPDNFLSEIHRKIEQEKSENPIKKISRMFIYFFNSFNFPLEAAGVLAIATVVFFLYRPFFNGKIQHTQHEYEIESPVTESAAEINKIPDKDKQSPIVRQKNLQLKKNGIASVKDTAENINRRNLSDKNRISIEKEDDYDSPIRDEIIVTDSEEKEKSSVKSDKKSYMPDSMEAGAIIKEEKVSVKTSDNEIEKIFNEFNITVIEKDLSDKEKLYFRIKILQVKHAYFIKKISATYMIEEKFIKKNNENYEIDIFLKKKKK